MKPYFQNHSAGWLFLEAVICFFGMEIIQFLRQRHWRRDATRIAPRGFWVAVVVWVIVATVGLAGFTLPCLAIILWRIHIEEAALLGTAGEPYRRYAEHHKRLIPLIW